MKKTMLLILAAVCLVLFSCAPVTNPEVNENGTITVKLPVANSKDINMTTAAANTNFYEIIVYNGSTTVTVDANTTSATKSISIPPGTYKVLVLAGYKDYYGYLLGSGLTENVVVTEGQNTQTSVTLKDVDINFSAPAQVSCGYNYTVSVSGDTGCSVLHVKSKPYITLSGSTTNTYLDFSQSGRQWECNATMTAPGTPASETISLYSNISCLYLVDSDYSISNYLYNYSEYHWYAIPNTSYLPTEATQSFNKPIEFIEGATGMGVEIKWGF